MKTKTLAKYIGDAWEKAHNIYLEEYEDEYGEMVTDIHQWWQQTAEEVLDHWPKLRTRLAKPKKYELAHFLAQSSFTRKFQALIQVQEEGFKYPNIRQDTKLLWELVAQDVKKEYL